MIQPDPARAMRRVQLRGGARWPHARRTLCTLRVRSRAPTKQMGPCHRSRGGNALMRYGFYLPTRGRMATPEDLEALVRRGEALGFASVMIADHIVFPSVVTSKYPYTVSGVFPGQGDALEQLAL